MLWRIAVEYPAGIVPPINAFLSEYMMWSFSGVVVVCYVVYAYWNKQHIETKLWRIILLTLTTALAALFLPVTPPYRIALFHIISDMRYLYIPVVLAMLGTFRIADEFAKTALLSATALASAMPLFSFIPYQPRTFLVCSILAIGCYCKRQMILRAVSQPQSHRNEAAKSHQPRPLILLQSISDVSLLLPSDFSCWLRRQEPSLLIPAGVVAFFLR